jgi:hypothetical protein
MGRVGVVQEGVYSLAMFSPRISSTDRANTGALCWLRSELLVKLIRPGLENQSGGPDHPQQVYIVTNPVTFSEPGSG